MSPNAHSHTHTHTHTHTCTHTFRISSHFFCVSALSVVASASASSVVAGGASSAVQRLEDRMSLAERAAAAAAASAERAADALRVAADSAAATDAAAAEADPALRLEAISAAVAMSSIERMMRAISSRSDVDSVCTGAGTAYASTRSVSAEMEALMTRMAFCSWISWCTIMDGLLFIFLTVVI